jgi:hypothetical protein
MSDIDNKGVEGEDFVNGLAFSSYLKYWCYPGPLNESGDKKEICDLLIVFKGIAIIFSVKNYEFKGNYERYFKSTIEKAVKQIQGAERKLFHSNQDIYIKHPDRDIERFPKESITKIFRVIVNLGEGLEYHISAEMTNKNEFISIFDKEDFKTIIEELDTISDLIHFLEAREALMRSKENLILEGKEKDLLAIYLENGREFDPKIINTENAKVHLVVDGSWEHFKKRKEVILKEAADKYSYLIDELVLREILKTPNGHLLAKELMSLDRYSRRVLAKSFINFFQSHNQYAKGYNARRYGKIGDLLFILFYYTPEIEEKVVDFAIETALHSHMIMSNYATNKIILLGITKDMKQFKFGYLEIEQKHSDEENRRIMSDANIFGWFKNRKTIEFTELEYPDE